MRLNDVKGKRIVEITHRWMHSSGGRALSVERIVLEDGTVLIPITLEPGWRESEYGHQFAVVKQRKEK